MLERGLRLLSRLRLASDLEGLRIDVHHALLVGDGIQKNTLVRRVFHLEGRVAFRETHLLRSHWHSHGTHLHRELVQELLRLLPLHHGRLLLLAYKLLVEWRLLLLLLRMETKLAHGPYKRIIDITDILSIEELLLRRALAVFRESLRRGRRLVGLLTLHGEELRVGLFFLSLVLRLRFGFGLLLVLLCLLVGLLLGLVLGLGLLRRRVLVVLVFLLFIISLPVVFHVLLVELVLSFLLIRVHLRVFHVGGPSFEVADELVFIVVILLFSVLLLRLVLIVVFRVIVIMLAVRVTTFILPASVVAVVVVGGFGEHVLVALSRHVVIARVVVPSVLVEAVVVEEVAVGVVEAAVG